MSRLPVTAHMSMPPFGLGTWRMGESRARRAAEVAALELGLELGVRLIDTAEMYGDGEAEVIVRDALHGSDARVFIVDKVLPQHATRSGTIRACEQSLRRLGVESIDLYLLHWRGRIPLEDTIAGFDALLAAGKIQGWGVSNFDTADMKALFAIPGGDACRSNQILYNLETRGPEWEVIPWCRARGVGIMAYSPVGQGELLRSAPLRRIAAEAAATPAQLALAWLLRQPNVTVIPKATDPAHVREDCAAVRCNVSTATLERLERAFPPPQRPAPLAMR